MNDARYQAPDEWAVSVVIPAHNAAETIERCLRALQIQTKRLERYEVIVVDDGSNDDTGARAKRMGARVLRQNRAQAAAARNTGIAAATGDILCFTDADCEPLPDWLAHLLAPFAQDSALAGVKGVYTTYQRALTARFVQVEYEEKYDRLREQKQIQFIDFYSAAFRRNVLVANEGFDERFPNSEDRELSFRLATRGYKLGFAPRAVVSHLHAATVADYARKKFQNGYWTAQVVRRFPTHGVDDSYTPQIMKLQIGLAAILLFTGASTLLFPEVVWGTLATLTLFFLTTIPFTRRAWARDRGVALIAPIWLLLRALALGFGYAWGLLNPIPDNEHQTPRISGWRYLVKRGMDLAAGTVGTLLLLPPGLWRQWRRHGRPVMERRNLVGQRGEVISVFSFKNDAAWQIPWLWHVLRGELSLVGPAPAMPEDVVGYDDWHRRRLAVKPGLIQPIRRDNTQSFDERVRKELAYIEEYTLRRDFEILWQCVSQRGNHVA